MYNVYYLKTPTPSIKGKKDRKTWFYIYIFELFTIS